MSAESTLIAKMDNIEYPEFKKQKLDYLNVMDIKCLSHEQRESMEGILNLLDAVTDFIEGEAGVVCVGDKVLVRGSFGTEEPAEAVVKSITSLDHEGQDVNDGMELPYASWDNTDNREYILTFDSGKWAYGNQVTRYDEE